MITCSMSIEPYLFREEILEIRPPAELLTAESSDLFLSAKKVIMYYYECCYTGMFDQAQVLQDCEANGKFRTKHFTAIRKHPCSALI